MDFHWSRQYNRHILIGQYSAEPVKRTHNRFHLPCADEWIRVQFPSACLHDFQPAYLKESYGIPEKQQDNTDLGIYGYLELSLSNSDNHYGMQ